MNFSKIPSWPENSLTKSIPTRIQNYLGFTLIELIVVITILAILGTIGFLSIGGYSSRARDSTRVADVGNIIKSLDISIITAGTYPTPDSAFFVTYSGWVIWSQGTVGNTVLQKLRTSIAGGGLNKKPIDPLDNAEYTYSTLAYGNAFQIQTEYEGDISQTASILPQNYWIEEAIAAPGAPNIAYIRWNYGWIMAKTLTGGVTYILAVPSIISNTGSTNDFLRIEQDRLSGALLFPGKNLIGASSFNPNLTPIFSGTGGVPSTNNDITNMMLALQNRYTGASADIRALTPIASILSMNTGSLNTLGVNLVKNQLWGSRISISNENENISNFTSFAGLGTSGSPWTKNDGSPLKNCQEYNTQAPVLNAGTARGAGACGTGGQACLTSGVYRIDPDGAATTVSPVNVYCDMTTDGGGWTLISKFSGASDGINQYSANTEFNASSLTNTNATSNAKLSTDAIYAMSTWPSSVFRVKSSSYDTLIKSTSVKNSFDPIRLNDTFACKQVSAGTWTNYTIQAVGVCSIGTDNGMTNRVTTWIQGCSYVGYSGSPAGNPCGDGSILAAASYHQWNDAGYTSAGTNPGIWYLR